MPLTSALAAPQSVYTGKAGGASRKNPMTLVVGIGIALVAIVAVSLIVRGGGEKKFVDDQTLVAPTPDGWRTFSSPDGTFSASFPGIPERSEKPLDSLNQIAVIYSMKQGDFEFGVAKSPAPAYTPPTEAAKRLEEWMRPYYESQGGVFEGAAQLLTPRGDQAFDAVVVTAGTRSWIRFTTWNGSIIRVFATLPADKQPTSTQSATYSRLRDSIHQ
jgi:hypothetical protein